MAQTTSISITVDEDIKKDAESLFARLGLTLSAATDIFYRQAVKTNGLPFSLNTIECPSHIQSRKNFGTIINDIQMQSVINGTDTLTLDEINDIISECRQEARDKR